MDTPKPATITLDEGMTLNLRVGADGYTVAVTADRDADGGLFLALGGVDCKLTGEEPGLYYPEPLDEEYVVLHANEDDPSEVWAYNRNATTDAGFVETLIPANDPRIVADDPGHAARSLGRQLRS